MDWIGLPEVIDDWFGFVYLITRINTMPGEPKYYVGCKQFHSKTKKPPLKGTKRKRIVIKHSDYQTYYGSSTELKAAIEKYGKDNFKREVLHLCETRWIMKYLEALEQLSRRALFRSDYYNGIVHIRLGKIPKVLTNKYANISDSFLTVRS